MRIWGIIILLGMITSACVIEEEQFQIIRNKHPSYPPVRYGSIEGTIPDAGSTGHERPPTPCLDAHDPGFFQVRQVDEGSFSRGPVASEPTTALVIFDKSGSMSSEWASEDPDDPGPVPTRWDAASEALVGAATPIQERLTLGAISFPVPDECDVAPIEHERQVSFRPGPKFLQRWAEVIPLNTPDGSTPLGLAFIEAESAIEDACRLGMLEQRFIVIVLTDGEPNCATHMETVLQMTSEWLKHGIPTYVFGLPGSERGVHVLNSIAAAGGTETLIVPGGPDELEDGMGAIM